MKAWYHTAKKKDRIATKKALEKYMKEYMDEEKLKAALAEMPTVKEKESEEEKPND